MVYTNIRNKAEKKSANVIWSYEDTKELCEVADKVNHLRYVEDIEDVNLIMYSIPYLEISTNGNSNRYDYECARFLYNSINFLNFNKIITTDVITESQRKLFSPNLEFLDFADIFPVIFDDIEGKEFGNEYLGTAVTMFVDTRDYMKYHNSTKRQNVVAVVDHADAEIKYANESYEVLDLENLKDKTVLLVLPDVNARTTKWLCEILRKKGIGAIYIFTPFSEKYTDDKIAIKKLVDDNVIDEIFSTDIISFNENSDDFLTIIEEK